MKRDQRDGKVRLIEVNPRVSGTGDCAIYTGVEVGWLHYLDLIGCSPLPVKPSRFNFRHITLRRDLPSIPRYFEQGALTWRARTDRTVRRWSSSTLIFATGG